VNQLPASSFRLPAGNLIHGPETGSWQQKLLAGDWKLAAGDWKLAAGDWKLEAGDWKLEAGS
jgi:hypothetical protein